MGTQSTSNFSHYRKQTLDKPQQSALEEFLIFIGGVFSFIGWVFFVVLLAFKLSGSAIYVTSSHTVIDKVEPVWKQATIEEMSKEAGARFMFRIKGNRKQKD